MKGTILLLLWKISSFLAGHLPLSFTYSLAVLSANITYAFWHRGRRHARIAMRRVLGRDSDSGTIDCAARRSFQNYFKNVVDFLRLPSVKPEDVEGAVQFNGWDKLDEALNQGKGVILVGLHFGNWDMAGAYLALRRYPVNVIIEAVPNSMVNYIAQMMRRRWGIKTIPMSSVAQVVRVLKRNEMLALLIDQPHSTSPLSVELFDAVANIPRGAATLALRTGAKIVPGAVVRLPNNRYQGFIDSQINFEPSGNLMQDTVELTRSILASLERMVRQYPDQWYVFRPLWVEN